MHAYMFCKACQEYGDRRMEVLAPHIVAAAVRRVIDPIAVLHDFMAGVHVRHVQGLPLSTPQEEIIDRLLAKFAAIGISLPGKGEVRYAEDKVQTVEHDGHVHLLSQLNGKPDLDPAKVVAECEETRA